MPWRAAAAASAVAVATVASEPVAFAQLHAATD